MLKDAKEQSVLEHLFRGSEFQEFKKSYYGFVYELCSEINLFEIYNILIQVSDTPTSTLSLLLQDETKVERHVCTILANLTNDLGVGCCNAVQVCEDLRKFSGGGIFGHKAFLSTNALEPILWALTTSMGAMTDLSARLPIVFRIQAILRASASDDPMSGATVELLTEPSFLSILHTNDWFTLAVKLYNFIDLCAARKLGTLCSTTYPQPRRFADPAKHLKP